MVITFCTQRQNIYKCGKRQEYHSDDEREVKITILNTECKCETKLS